MLILFNTILDRRSTLKGLLMGDAMSLTLLTFCAGLSMPVVSAVGAPTRVSQQCASLQVLVAESGGVPWLVHRW